MKLAKWRPVKPETMFRIYVDAEHEKSGAAGTRRLMAEALVDATYPHPCVVRVCTAIPASDHRTAHSSFVRGVPIILVQVHLPEDDSDAYNQDDPPAVRVLGHWLADDEWSQPIREGLPS